MKLSWQWPGTSGIRLRVAAGMGPEPAEGQTPALHRFRSDRVAHAEETGKRVIVSVLPIN